jgi:hypothetical protein
MKKDGTAPWEKMILKTFPISLAFQLFLAHVHSDLRFRKDGKMFKKPAPNVVTTQLQISIRENNLNNRIPFPHSYEPENSVHQTSHYDNFLSPL